MSASASLRLQAQVYFVALEKNHG